MIKVKRVFVTGGTGFLGKPLVKLLEKNGYQLLLLARSPEKYHSLLNAKKTKLVRGDLSNFKVWSRVVSEFKPDLAIHLAWQGIPDFSYEVCSRNLKYGLDLFEFLARIGCKSVITAGSSWEYGLAAGRVREDAPVRPSNALAATKDALHNLGCEIAKANGQNFIWLRPFSIYGPGHRKTSLVLHLVGRYKAGEPVKVDNPSVGNDFVYVQDAAEAITTIIDQCRTSGHQVFNIGHGKLVGVAEVANIVYGKKVLNVESPKGFYADISHIKKLGWHPRTSITEGIKKTMLLEGYI
ncbi:MAG: hypothetical protein A2831_02295 [Candidatus Yanofskybacteria bacterium RIFCSPHIGHO2_01_FULL_44_17]|uniref:NAD-dependent epimerase/dehydratase domain-containing protein n=1 Tax=Candidatus Yanofskybacteria bacterium RIFCSPHIGHO2_01_FULL_44_17 TaxID=1802668 RepID=A0A1F8EUE8_9BACT|nr:MAG: hypothetical protein A2831_02295 [Candidatus Yanofskybacteria bacterium RIFCSPHIGHO2_01_FULL_44_17]